LETVKFDLKIFDYKFTHFNLENWLGHQKVTLNQCKVTSKA